MVWARDMNTFNKLRAATANASYFSVPPSSQRSFVPLTSLQVTVDGVPTPTLFFDQAAATGKIIHGAQPGLTTTLQSGTGINVNPITQGQNAGQRTIAPVARVSQGDEHAAISQAIASQGLAQADGRCTEQVRDAQTRTPRSNFDLLVDAWSKCRCPTAPGMQLRRSARPDPRPRSEQRRADAAGHATGQSLRAAGANPAQQAQINKQFTQINPQLYANLASAQSSMNSSARSKRSNKPRQWFHCRCANPCPARAESGRGGCPILDAAFCGKGEIARTLLAICGTVLLRYDGRWPTHLDKTAMSGPPANYALFFVVYPPSVCVRECLLRCRTSRQFYRWVQCGDPRERIHLQPRSMLFTLYTTSMGIPERIPSRKAFIVGSTSSGCNASSQPRLRVCSLVNPVSFVHLELTSRLLPSASRTHGISGLSSTIFRRCSSLSRRASSVRLRAVMSTAASETPITSSASWKAGWYDTSMVLSASPAMGDGAEISTSGIASPSRARRRYGSKNGNALGITSFTVFPIYAAIGTPSISARRRFRLT